MSFRQYGYPVVGMENFMAKRKVAYRKRVQNRFSMFLVSLVVLLIIIEIIIVAIFCCTKEINKAECESTTNHNIS